AFSISLIPMRSLTDPPGLMYSSLASTVAASSGTMRWSRASGVLPTRSRTVGYSRAMREKRNPTDAVCKRGGQRAVVEFDGCEPAVRDLSELQRRIGTEPDRQ